METNQDQDPQQKSLDLLIKILKTILENQQEYRTQVANILKDQINNSSLPQDARDKEIAIINSVLIDQKKKFLKRVPLHEKHFSPSLESIFLLIFFVKTTKELKTTIFSSPFLSSKRKQMLKHSQTEIYQLQLRDLRKHLHHIITNHPDEKIP